MWFRKRKVEQPLTGAPTALRLKTYSASSGYVFQYVFVGQHIAPGAVEYLFDISPDRKTWSRIPVRVSDAALQPWVEDNGRTLTNSERYAVAKIALRNAFDNCEAPARIGTRLTPEAAEVIAILEELGV